MWDYRKPIPNDVEITNYSLDGVLLTPCIFDEDYSKMSAVDEVLCRAAVVRTMTQIDGVDCVAFYIGDAPLTDAKGNLVWCTMNQGQPSENPGGRINSIQEYDTTLYFSNLDGDGLVKEVREDVYYSSNISMEKLIMEQLLDGPKTKDAKSAIPEGTKLVSVSVVDGVCYVSLDEAFKNQDYKVNEAIVIYSIVDSLSELSTISKVQISGSTAIRAEPTATISRSPDMRHQYGLCHGGRERLFGNGGTYRNGLKGEVCDKTAFVSWRSGRSVGDSCGGIRLERIRAGIASLRRPGLRNPWRHFC